MVTEIKGIEAHTRRCEKCGAAFIGGARARYCSVACRVAAHRQRNPDARKRRESAS